MSPTIFYILENKDLGTWWVGKMVVTLTDGWPNYRPVTQDELCIKLQKKFEHFSNPYLTLSPLNKGWVSCYGVERWLSKLEYKINKNPETYYELKELLTAGWCGEKDTSTLSVLHVFHEKQPVEEIFNTLVKSREGLDRCINTCTGKTRKDKYNENKNNPDFLKTRARKKVLYDMNKTQKTPKHSTIKKYEITDHEIISALVYPT
jgi:hypothetical protein